MRKQHVMPIDNPSTLIPVKNLWRQLFLAAILK